MNRHLTLPTPHGPLIGQLTRPPQPHALILIANPAAEATTGQSLLPFAEQGLAILELNLLTPQETHYADASQDVHRLTQRLILALDFIRGDGDTADLPLAIIAIGDATPAAIRAATQRDQQVQAVIAYGGLIDRAGRQALEWLSAPLLMLFTAEDEVGRQAFARAQSHFNTPSEVHQLADGDGGTALINDWLGLRLGLHAAGSPTGVAHGQ